jgi:hypothetical protein
VVPVGSADCESVFRLTFGRPLAAFSAALLLLIVPRLCAALFLSWRSLVTLLLTLLLIAALILLNILVRIRHLKYLIAKVRQPAHNYELADYNR